MRNENIDSTENDRETGSGKKKNTNKHVKQHNKSEDHIQGEFCKPGIGF